MDERMLLAARAASLRLKLAEKRAEGPKMFRGDVANYRAPARMMEGPGGGAPRLYQPQPLRMFGHGSDPTSFRAPAQRMDNADGKVAPRQPQPLRMFGHGGDPASYQAPMKLMLSPDHSELGWYRPQPMRMFGPSVATAPESSPVQYTSVDSGRELTARSHNARAVGRSINRGLNQFMAYLREKYKRRMAGMQ